jgi:RNA polymerase sigma-70 factor (ECF subfamily)
MGLLRRFNPDESDSNETPRSSDDARPAGRVLDAEYLIRQAFATDPDTGMALLFQHYYGPLCSHAVRFVASKAIAEDLVSDVYYEFQVGRLDQRVTTSFRAFLFTVVRNRAFDYVRAELRRSTSLDGAAALPLRADQQPDHLTQFEELYHDVEGALDALPHRRRQIYVMHRFEGKKYGEIATELGLSTRTVEAQMYRAIHQVRAFLAQKWLVAVLLAGWCA